MTEKEFIKKVTAMNMPNIEEAHDNIVLSKVKSKQSVAIKRFVPIAACIAIIFAVAISIPCYIQQHSDTNTSSQLSKSVGAIYHNIDVTQLVFRPWIGIVPASFWPENRIQMGAQVKIKDYLGTVLKWQKSGFTDEDLQSYFKTQINAPKLPDGDYTTEQSILVDTKTATPLVYQTIYYYYDVKTNEVINSFRIFYFKTDTVLDTSIQSSDNIMVENGVVRINDFSTGFSLAHQLPHMRNLVYIKNGFVTYVTSQANPFVTYVTSQVNPITSTVKIDEAKTADLSTQTDKEIISIMESCIKH